MEKAADEEENGKIVSLEHPGRSVTAEDIENLENDSWMFLQLFPTCCCLLIIKSEKFLAITLYEGESRI